MPLTLAHVHLHQAANILFKAVQWGILRCESMLFEQVSSGHKDLHFLLFWKLNVSALEVGADASVSTVS